MTRGDVAGWLLLGSFALWIPAAALPARIWTAPHPERLALNATWSGWAAIALAGLVLVQLLVTGDALPALYHLGPAVIGATLLLY